MSSGRKYTVRSLVESGKPYDALEAWHDGDMQQLSITGEALRHWRRGNLPAAEAVYTDRGIDPVVAKAFVSALDAEDRFDKSIA